MVKLKDVQNEPDERGIEIEKVGIKNFQLPIYVRDRTKKDRQPSVGTFNVYSSLPKELKGVHMSHFASVLQGNLLHETVSLVHLEEVKDIIKAKQLEEMPEETKDINVHLEMEFVYFNPVMAPRSNVKGQLPIECKFVVSDLHPSTLQVKVPVTTLCPCSKEMSEKGAHNQRSWITISVQTNEWVWIEELVELAEEAASCPIYPILRRADEKAVTDWAYENPKFVEDVVRDLELLMKKDKRIDAYKLYVENEESIHVHNAYAEIVSASFDNL